MAGEETTNKSNITQNFNAGQTGLNMDNTLGQIKKGTLTYALNANVENFDSNSVNYQNEEGNVPCVNEEGILFPDNTIVIGTHFINEQSKHIFFLVNTETGDSEIGQIVNNDCIYTTILADDCLSFDINYPIQKAVHRLTNCTTEIYWTDGKNPRRYLDIDNPPITDICNNLKIQPNFPVPQLTITDVVTGGELISGTYQFAIQYCDAVGFGYTSYYSVTNPVSIANTQTYDGTSWTAGGNLGTARQDPGGAGTQTAGLGFGGYVSSFGRVANTEEYTSGLQTRVIKVS